MNSFEKTIKNKIFSLKPEEFEAIALELFYFQSVNNVVYRNYLSLLGINPSNITSLENIPFLPVEFFKTQKVISGNYEPTLYFKSSGTTGQQRSVHYVAKEALYRESLLKGFELFWGSPEKYIIAGLSPSFSAGNESSLVYMINELIIQSGHQQSGFYLGKEYQLSDLEKTAINENRTLFIIGLTYALTSFALHANFKLKKSIVVETGGMKGRSNDIPREELHQIIQKQLDPMQIASEYGMTELLSQAWAVDGRQFSSVPWLKVLVSDPYDPFSFLPENRPGIINLIDLANIDSCAFIRTQDLGTVFSNGSFEISGRSYQSDLRGCNLMMH